MATSGTRTFTLNAADAIEEAYELAGLEYRTGYDGVTARRSMNIMFADWSNRGVQLWEVEQVSLDLVQGTTSYSLNEFDIDILDAIELANKHPRVNILNPGIGVGGHCIPVDPWFIVHSSKKYSSLIKRSREINDEKTNCYNNGAPLVWIYSRDRSCV